MALNDFSPMKLLGWLLNINEQSSGKRQIAGVFAIATLVIIIWRLPHLSDTSQMSIIEWLIIGAFALIATAFGMESLINQAGLKFRSSEGITRPKPKPERDTEDELE